MTARFYWVFGTIRICMEEKYFYEKDGVKKLLTLDQSVIGKGGQAMVYGILFPIGMADFCVKVYHKGCHTNLIERLKYMIHHPPAVIRSSNFRICWPQGLVYNGQGEVVGFYMPKAFPHSRDLYILSYYTKGKTISDRFKKDTEWFGKYERNTGEGILNRLKMMANISQAFYQLHRTRNYVMLDLKPQNILATSNGYVSIVDTDSFQIAEGNHILFNGAAVTPEYCAPEFDDQYEQGRPLTSSNDAFSLAVIFYQILVGLHPYTGVKLLPPYDTDEYSEIKAVIHRSLFLYGSNKRYIQMLQPNPHGFFERMPRSLQLMFIKSFDAPNYRPTMEDWCKELFKLIPQ